VPILVVSVVDERLEGLRLGAVEYLVKPVDRARLVEAASRVLGRNPAAGRFEPSPRVLVVDDEEEVQQLLARSLRVNGFKVETASTAREALEKLQDSPPDLVLLDLFLPDASGWDVLMRVKATPEGSAIPVIILTAHSEPEQMREGERLGVDAFLAKPIDMNSILERIKALLRESGAA
jgi:DNA-binding response OmpR family regulator